MDVIGPNGAYVAELTMTLSGRALLDARRTTPAGSSVVERPADGGEMPRSGVVTVRPGGRETVVRMLPAGCGGNSDFAACAGARSAFARSRARLRTRRVTLKVLGSCGPTCCAETGRSAKSNP